MPGSSSRSIPRIWCGARGDAWGWRALLGHDLPDHPDDDPLCGVKLQMALERRAALAGGGGNRAPSQRNDCFLAGDGRVAEPAPTSYRPGLTACDLGALLPTGMTDRLRAAMRQFDRTLPGFSGADGQLIGVETRTSSPVRVARDPETTESAEVAGLHPCGEGAGYAGGIVSAALDGRRVAAALAARR